MTSWEFPLNNWLGVIPSGPLHPGSFGAHRRYDVHTGVDLYCTEGELVYAVEHGRVVAIENFTGPDAESPWWLPTKAVLVEGLTGVVCYGEIEPQAEIQVNSIVISGMLIGKVVPVLKESPRPDIPGHSQCMLHFELHKHGADRTVWWYHGKDKPEYLVDPTELLQKALNNNRDKKHGK